MLIGRLVMLELIPSLLLACMCPSIPPMCELDTSRDGMAVFVGTAVKLRSRPNKSRVRLEVLETFVGPQVSEIRLTTGRCGFEFEKGKTYFVVAYGGEGCWSVPSCSGTSDIEEAEQEIRTLRARLENRTLAPRIYGQIISSRDYFSLGGIRVFLRGPGRERQTITDAHGRFLFDAVPQAIHCVSAEHPDWSTDWTVDWQMAMKVPIEPANEIDLADRNRASVSIAMDPEE
jgi:hypothetical protein